MKIIPLIFLMVSISLSGLTQECTLKLSGHVEDLDTRLKLSAATVTIKETNQTIITDEKGDFTFPNLCPGSYTLVITHVECPTLEKKISLSKNLHLDLDMPHFRNTNLEEVTVTALKGMNNTGYKQELKGRALEETKGLSLSEALSRINGVTLLQTGSTISKPVIHGLHSNRIITINNGVRQEGQQWGNEHAPEVDPFIADNLTVIKGVDELRYGSDAIGGVVIINPKMLRSTPGSYAEVNTAYFTNNGEYVVSGMLEHQLKKLPSFTYRIQGTLKRAGNVATPDYRINNTGLREDNFSLTAGWKKTAYQVEAYYSQFNTRIGIFSGAEVGGIADLQNRIDSNAPAPVFTGERTYTINRSYQDVLHRLFKLKSGYTNRYGKFNLQLSAQFNNRREYDIVRNAAMKGPQMDLNILTLTEDASWEHPKVKNLQGTIGLSAMQQDNTYTGRYLIPNYYLNSFGAYWIEKWTKHQWEIQGGLRYDYKDLHTQRIPATGPQIVKDFHFSTLAASFNTTYKFSPDIKINAGVSLASRSPQVNELLSNGIHQGVATYEQGIINNPSNDTIPKIERSVNLAAGFSYANKAKTFFLTLDLYNNIISNFVYGQPMPDAPVQTISGAYRLVQFMQVDAVLRGADISASYFFNKQLELSSKASLLRARNRTLGDWQLLMPSDRLTNTLTYNFKDKGRLSQSYISVEVPYVFKQTRVPDESKHGRQDYKPAPDGYTLINLNASTMLKAGKIPFTISMGVRNLLNTTYRDYLNSFRYFTDEMGRNISLRLKLPLENLFHH